MGHSVTRLELTVYVDDQHVSMVGKREEVIEQVAGGTASLEQVVIKEFKASFATDKNAHVGTDRQPAEAIGKALDGGSGAAGTSCENLGVDFQVGAPRATK